MSVLSIPTFSVGNIGLSTKSIIIPDISEAPDNVRFSECTPLQITSYRWMYSIIDTDLALIASGEIQAITRTNSTLRYSQFGITGDRINYKIEPVINGASICIKITNLSNNYLTLNLRRIQT